MSLLVAAVAEHLVTMTAFKRSLLEVDSPHVAVQVRDMRKGLGALVAVVEVRGRVHLHSAAATLSPSLPFLLLDLAASGLFWRFDTLLKLEIVIL